MKVIEELYLMFSKDKTLILHLFDCYFKYFLQIKLDYFKILHQYKHEISVIKIIFDLIILNKYYWP